MPKFGGRRTALRFKYYFNSNLIQRGGSNRVARRGTSEQTGHQNKLLL